MKQEKSSVPAVDNAINILNFLSRRSNQNSLLTRISTGLGINKSTCLRILRVLRDYDIVSYNEEGKTYNLGSRLVILGARAAEYSPLLKTVMPYMQELVEKTGMTSVLLQRASNDRVVVIAKCEPHHSIAQIKVEVGHWFYIASVATGLCHMAYMSKSEVDRILAGQAASDERRFPTSISDMRELENMLEKIRTEGVCTTFEDHFPHPMVVTTAAPVFDISGRVSVSIACIAMYSTMVEEHVSKSSAAVLEVSREITAALGGRRALRESREKP